MLRNLFRCLDTVPMPNTLQYLNLLLPILRSVRTHDRFGA